MRAHLKSWYCARHTGRDQSGRKQLGQCAVHAGDNIIITQMEHHANIVPWQMLCERVGRNCG
jgi:selenocysteine lyase/cysteine desulfurase